MPRPCQQDRHPAPRGKQKQHHHHPPHGQPQQQQQERFVPARPPARPAWLSQTLPRDPTHHQARSGERGPPTVRAANTPTTANSQPQRQNGTRPRLPRSRPQEEATSDGPAAPPSAPPATPTKKSRTRTVPCDASPDADVNINKEISAIVNCIVGRLMEVMSRLLNLPEHAPTS